MLRCHVISEFKTAQLVSLSDCRSSRKPLAYMREIVPGSLPDSCTLCWDTLEIESSYRRLPCGHAFHLPCIDRWLLSQDASCPYCRRTFYHFRRPRLIFVPDTDQPLTHKTSLLTLLRHLRLWLSKKLSVD